jgi:hypothetical protein
MHSWNTFSVMTSYMQPPTHKIHHGPDLGKATTFRIIIYSAFRHGGHILLDFCPGSLEIFTVGTPATLGVHNFAWKLVIAMRSKAKL